MRYYDFEMKKCKFHLGGTIIGLTVALLQIKAVNMGQVS